MVAESARAGNTTSVRKELKETVMIVIGMVDLKFRRLLISKSGVHVAPRRCDHAVGVVCHAVGINYLAAGLVYHAVKAVLFTGS